MFVSESRKKIDTACFELVKYTKWVLKLGIKPVLLLNTQLRQHLLSITNITKNKKVNRKGTCCLYPVNYKGLPTKKIFHSRVAQLCYPKNVQIIWDNLFSGSP
jgi:hypothetical protein